MGNNESSQDLPMKNKVRKTRRSVFENENLKKD
jgi:hypothetical protein